MSEQYDGDQQPAEVTWAWRVMVAEVGLGLLGVVVSLLTVDTLRDYLRDQRPRASSAELDQAVTAVLVSAVVFGLLFAVLWLWLADRVRQGRPWARIVTLLFAGVGIVFGLLRLATGQPPLIRLLDVVGLLLDVAIVVLLFRFRAQEYFRRSARYRAPARRRPVS